MPVYGILWSLPFSSVQESSRVHKTPQSWSLQRVCGAKVYSKQWRRTLSPVSLKPEENPFLFNRDKIELNL